MTFGSVNGSRICIVPPMQKDHRSEILWQCFPYYHAPQHRHWIFTAWDTQRDQCLANDSYEPVHLFSQKHNLQYKMLSPILDQMTLISRFFIEIQNTFESLSCYWIYMTHLLNAKLLFSSCPNRNELLVLDLMLVILTSCSHYVL